MLARAKGLAEESYLSSSVTRQMGNPNQAKICVAQRSAIDATATEMAARIGQGVAYQCYAHS